MGTICIRKVELKHKRSGEQGRQCLLQLDRTTNLKIQTTYHHCTALVWSNYNTSAAWRSTKQYIIDRCFLRKNHYFRWLDLADVKSAFAMLYSSWMNQLVHNIAFPLLSMVKHWHKEGSKYFIISWHFTSVDPLFKKKVCSRFACSRATVVGGSTDSTTKSFHCHSQIRVRYELEFEQLGSNYNLVGLSQTFKTNSPVH